MTQENTTPKKTRTEYVEKLQRLFTEIESITESIKEIKDEAKNVGYDSALLAKVAKARATMKTEDLLTASEAVIELIEEVRGN